MAYTVMAYTVMAYTVMACFDFYQPALEACVGHGHGCTH